MTPEELIENSEEPRRCEYGMYGYSSCGRLEDHTFEFDDNPFHYTEDYVGLVVFNADCPTKIYS